MSYVLNRKLDEGEMRARARWQEREIRAYEEKMDKANIEFLERRHILDRLYQVRSKPSFDRLINKFRLHGFACDILCLCERERGGKGKRNCCHTCMRFPACNCFSVDCSLSADCEFNSIQFNHELETACTYDSNFYACK